MTMNLSTIGSMNYNVLSSIISHGNFLKLKRGAEVGVLYGDTSDFLLNYFQDLTLFSVDPYQAYEEKTEPRSQADMNTFEMVARDKLARYGARSEMIKKYSLEASQEIENNSLDFVFIDASHTYDDVKIDLKCWYPKIRSGGLFSGHDYRSFPGVTQAVDEFSKEQRLDGYMTPLESDIWFFVKP